MRKTKLSFCFLLLCAAIFFSAGLLSAQNKSLKAIRVTEAPQIDGLLQEPEWRNAPVASDFTQRSPNPGRPQNLRTEVRVMYDDASLYIGARLFDVSPDSILKELTRRDERGQADLFSVYLDTYNNDQDAFEFMVSAAGVQLDARRTPLGKSYNWNAAWKSAVHYEGNDWYVEMEIPFSAIRFPKTDIQHWGVNFSRSVRRKNEYAYWNEINPNVDGFVNQFGDLVGINYVKSPIRLQLSPYISSYVNHASADGERSGQFTQAANYGMDLKYGINDAFTLDMMLIPDFGQVQSDNQVLNLSPFEVFFDENRQFFTEGTELFNKGNFFYSRRIGGQPMWHGRVRQSLEAGERITYNPLESRIINATKISGRMNSGLGLGVLNAVTARTFAEVTREDGTVRKVETNPLTNYNVVAIDQSFRNNSYISLINTNVTRGGQGYDANLMGTAFRIANNANSVAVSGKFGYSAKFGGEAFENKPETGYTSSVAIDKIGGNWRFGVRNYVESDTYDPNDLGFMRANNEIVNSAHLGYYRFEPFGKLLRLSSHLNLSHNLLYNPSVFTSLQMSGNVSATFDNFFSNGFNWAVSPTDSYDYFEPRVVGRYFTRPTWQSFSYWFGTDGRKRFIFSGSLSYRNTDFKEAHYVGLGFSPKFRVNDKLSLQSSWNIGNSADDVGYVSRSGGKVNFGLRDVNTLTNIFTTKYTFNNRMDLFLRMRHYWSVAEYKEFFELSDQGALMETDYQAAHDRNFNAFNIDMVYTWTFAPASEISIVWKNAILTDDPFLSPGYFNNLGETMSAPQMNSISVRVLYLLDYSMVMKSRKNNRLHNEQLMVHKFGA